jgi:alkaline phosphatase D
MDPCWVRTAGESAVRMKAWMGCDTADIISSTEVFSTAEKDFTAVLELTGLEPESTYQYNILIDGFPVFDDQDIPDFTTGRTNGSPGTFRVAFGGGAGYNPEAEKIWTSILDRNPDALLLLGDNVYVDMPEMPGPFHDYTYYRRQSRPEFRSLISRIPVYSIWDDHDAGIDDIWMGPYVQQPDWKVPMIKHYQRNWVNPGYGTEEWPGCWFSFIQGDIEFFMLDGRTYRTNPFGPDPTMLGPVQKEWLIEKLELSTARIKVLVSPVPWNYRAKPGSHDTWDGFRKERDEIFRLISDKGINSVVLMSADRHRSEVWEVEWEGDYPIYEFLSSRLTNMHFHDNMPGAIFSYNDLQSFGLLTFSTKMEPPEAHFEIINLHGESVYENTFIIGQQ